MIEIWIISFLTGKFLYPCVSFVYLSLFSLSMLLFKIFNFRFHIFFDWSFFDLCFRDSRYSAQLSCAIGSIVVFIYAEYFCSFRSRLFSIYNMFFPGLLFAEIFSWLKILMVEKLVVKNLSTLDGLVRQFFTHGSPTPYGYTAGVRPIKVASLGT